MTLAVMKTKAEQAIAVDFERALDRLPGGRAVSDERRRAFAVFAERGLPHRRVEEWKYTDLRAALREALPLAVGDGPKLTAAEVDRALGALAAIDATRLVMVNGRFQPELSDSGETGKVEIASLADALMSAPEGVARELIRPLGPADESMAALNSATATDGMIVRIAAGAVPARPIMIVHIETGPGQLQATMRNSVVVKAGAQATVLEVFAALEPAVAGSVNAATQISVGDGAQVEHAKVILGGGTHVATIAARLGTACNYRAFQYTERAGLVRNQSFVSFDGENAKLDLSGAMLGRGREHIDTTMTIDHTVPGCESRELFKTVLDGSARAVFQGKVVVRQAAQKTDGKQMAQALMLSEDAEFDSKPELEIYADDVVCGHGSTCAEIDPQMLFYLRTRGIPLAEARAMLIESFVGEAIEKVEHEGLREALAQTATAWLSGGT